MINQQELFENQSDIKTDWTGNKISSYVMNGCSNHSDKERQNEDYYATDPRAVEELLKKESFQHPIWENACGGCHITNVLKSHGYNVFSSDLINRQNPNQDAVIDFLKYKDNQSKIDIVTNPPYKFAKEFVEHSLELIEDGCKVAMFLKLTFLEGGGEKNCLRNTHQNVFMFFQNELIVQKMEMKRNSMNHPLFVMHGLYGKKETKNIQL